MCLAHWQQISEWKWWQSESLNILITIIRKVRKPFRDAQKKLFWNMKNPNANFREVVETIAWLINIEWKINSRWKSAQWPPAPLYVGSQICLNIQLRKERANSEKKRAEPTLSCFCIFRPKWEPTYNGAGGHWALFHLLLIFHSIFINQAMVSTTSLKFALGFFMFQNNVFLSISEWLSNLPNDCDQYIQAFTLPPFPLWYLLPVCKTHVNVAV
jgi:hypothetical protein